MNTMEIGHFVKGLKAYINSSQITQEEFAQGVTSKVNLSNVLRGNSGTSEKMRMALAKKTGLSMEELIALGQGKEQVPVRSQAQSVTKISYDAIAEMNAAEVLDKTVELKNQMLDAVMSHNKQLQEIISTLVQQRDEMRKRLAQHKVTVNVMEQPLITVNRKFKVLDCNRVASEELGVFPNATITFAEDVLEQVFATGRKQVTEVEGRTAYIYAVYDDLGQVSQAVLAIRAHDA